MKGIYKEKNISKNKLVCIAFLFLISICIIILGISFSIYSIIYQVSFKVLYTNIPGIIFGLTSLYLGIRYFLSVKRLQIEVFKPTANFSWKHFKRKNKR